MSHGETTLILVVALSVTADSWSEVPRMAVTVSASYE